MKNGLIYKPNIGESYSRLVCRSPKAKTLAHIQVPLLLVVSRTTQWMDLTHPVPLLREGSRLCLASAPRPRKVAHTCHFKKFSSRCRYGKQLAMVNGSNSASNKAIEIPHGESAPIGCSASYMGPQFNGRISALHAEDRDSISRGST